MKIHTIDLRGVFNNKTKARNASLYILKKTRQFNNYTDAPNFLVLLIIKMKSQSSLFYQKKHQYLRMCVELHSLNTIFATYVVRTLTQFVRLRKDFFIVPSFRKSQCELNTMIWMCMQQSISTERFSSY